MDEKTPGGGTTLADRKNSEGYSDPTAYAAMRRIEKGEAMSNGTFDIRRGDIFYVNRFPTVGSEIHTGRPAIVVSNNEIHENSATCIHKSKRKQSFQPSKRQPSRHARSSTSA